MTNTKTQKILKISIVMIMLLFSFSPAEAQTPKPGLPDYTVLTPLPGTTNPCTVVNGKQTCTTDFATYFPNMFNLIIGVAAGLAFIMITIGGITYATSDALQGKSDGRRYVTNAIYGLLLVIGAYTILWTINPQILNFNLVVTPPVVTPGTPTVVTVSNCCTYTGGILNGYTLTTAEINQNAVMVKDLQNSNVEVNNNGKPCANGETTGCTNIVGLPPAAINGAKSLKGDCAACVVIISGGTEGGHAEHAPGKAVIDLHPTQTVNDYLSKRANPKVSTPKNGTTAVVGNGTYTYEETGANGRATAPHWHVVYK